MSNNNHLYHTPEQRLDTMLGDARFWSMMSRCRKEENIGGDELVGVFAERYGILLRPNDGTVLDGFSPEVVIVDEQKYTVFLLKYTT